MKRSKLLPLTIIVLLGTLVSGGHTSIARGQAGNSPRLFVLAVGIGQYPNSVARNVSKDVQQVVSRLGRVASVVSLIDADADRILAALRDIRRRAVPGDAILFYYTGGIDSSGLQFSFVGHDSRRITMREIEDLWDGIEKRVVIIDSPFDPSASGGTANSGALVNLSSQLSRSTTVGIFWDRSYRSLSDVLASVIPTNDENWGFGRQVQGVDQNGDSKLDLRELMSFLERENPNRSKNISALGWAGQSAEIVVAGQPIVMPPPTNPAPGVTTVARYPSIVAPDEVIAEQEFALQVALTEEQETSSVRIEGGTSSGGAIVFKLPNDRDIWELGVVISTDDFKILGSNMARIVLPKKGSSSIALFQLSGKAIQQASKQSKITASLWYQNGYQGKFSREITIRKAGGSNAPAVFKDTRGVASESVSLQLGLQSPDLTIMITGSQIITSGDDKLGFYPYVPHKDLSTWVAAQFKEIAARGSRSVTPTGGATPGANADFMKGFGRQLYDKFAPEAFKVAFWNLTEKLGPRFRTIQVISDDSSLPWELMRPSKPDGTGERNFLGTEFNIARWHVRQSVYQFDRPPQSLSFEKMVVMAPAYSGPAALPAQRDELAALKQVPGFITVPGSMAAMRQLMAALPEGIVHFSGHGVVDRSSNPIADYAISLEDGSLSLMAWRGMSVHGGKHPLFFFNACEVGLAERVANFVDGWAPAVLEAGASGYIGALWPIGDKGAADFASSFYETLSRELKDGTTTVGDVLRQSRALYAKNADPTFLAYVYYGDPHLKLHASGH